ncbi:MAG: Uma2 family endonuclease [Cyanobacteria bacterium J06634_6]
MVQQLSKTSKADVVYPERDGNPMSDNTKQFRWIVTIKENLEIIFKDDPNVFVAGDLLWYAVEGDNKTRQAPDAMVAFGRPKGDSPVERLCQRGSYRQWEEDNIAPKVVFEILSPGNRGGELARKFQFYQRYGVQEYYVYDPDNIDFFGWEREGNYLEPIEIAEDWTSPCLKVRFVLTPETLEVYRPDGKPFLTPVELQEQLQETEQKLNKSEQKLNESESKNARLAERLRELGIDPADI